VAWLLASGIGLAAAKWLCFGWWLGSSYVASAWLRLSDFG